MKTFTFLIASIFLFNSCSKDEVDSQTQTVSRVLSNNSEQGLYEVNTETGQSALLISYDYYEMYKPLFISSSNRLIIPGHIRNDIRGFISVDLTTMAITEFQNEDCWKNLVLNPLNGKIYSSNYNKGLFEVNITTGESNLLVNYDYGELYKPAFVEESNKLVIPGFIKNLSDSKGFITIDLKDFNVTELLNNDCYKNFIALQLKSS